MNPPDVNPRRAPAVRVVALALGSLALFALGFFALSRAGVLKPPVPTPACVQPKLALGASQYRIQSLTRSGDGAAPIPAEPADVAHWVQGANIHYVFGLSPASANLALKDRLKPGDGATITWADCVTETYTIQTVQAGLPDLAPLLGQTTGGLTVYVQGSSPAEGLVVSAAPPQAPPAGTPQPVETPAGPQVDLAFGETKVSPNGKQITIDVTLTNSGAAAFSLAPGDISLATENGQPQPPLAVDPALPQEVKPGAHLALRLTFPKPAAKVATLRILEMTMDQYF